MNIIGDVEGRRCILFDDIVDSRRHPVNAAKALMDKGAIEVSAYISHGVLSGAAVQRVNAAAEGTGHHRFHRTAARGFRLLRRSARFPSPR